jgi:hypothetical protein
MTAFVGPEQTARFTLVVLRSALKFYAKTGNKVNRMYSLTNMLKTVSKFSGYKYPRSKIGAEKALRHLNQLLD